MLASEFFRHLQEQNITDRLSGGSEIPDFGKVTWGPSFVRCVVKSRVRNELLELEKSLADLGFQTLSNRITQHSYGLQISEVDKLRVYVEFSKYSSDYSSLLRKKISTKL